MMRFSLCCLLAACHGSQCDVVASTPVIDAAVVDAPSFGVEFVPCPIAPEGARPTQLAALLEAAQRALASEDSLAAYTCADQAAELEPASIEAAALRAEALYRADRINDAMYAYNLLLAMDPNGAETLASAAQFIAETTDGQRDELLQILALVARAKKLVRADATTARASLFGTEAIAYNELGHADKALVSAQRGLTIDPSGMRLGMERAFALYQLGRTDEAASAYEALLANHPAEADLHAGMGRIWTWRRATEKATAAFAKAASLAPDKYTVPPSVPESAYAEIVQEVVAELHADHPVRLGAVKIVVVDVPSNDDLVSQTPPFSPAIVGLFRDEGAHRGTIFLFKDNLAMAARDEASLRREIRNTLRHELEHSIGASEDDLRRRGMQ